jgi:MSHA biogenesis protein MshN
MSVINKMLRDLDQRKSAEPILHPGTASVPSQGLRARQPKKASRWIWLVWLLFGALLVVSGLVLWWQTSPGTPDIAPLSTAVSAVKPAVPASAPAPVPASTPAAEPVAVAPALALPSAVPVPVPVPATKPVAAASAMPHPAPLPKVAPASVSASAPALRLERALPAPAASQAATAPAAAKPAASVPRESNPQRQQLAAKDTLLNAQTMWNAGSREAAIDILQEAVASAERSATPAQLLPPLVRELARMQLAESRPGAVWELLARLEPQLRNEADLWAVRANAAQRLGRHQDSLQSYMTALQSRPTEQRWLLGAAVSLAALGQTANAAEMADKARASGPISRDVLQYLRQMGVPVKDQ